MPFSIFGYLWNLISQWIENKILRCPNLLERLQSFSDRLWQDKKTFFIRLRLKWIVHLLNFSDGCCFCLRSIFLLKYALSMTRSFKAFRRLFKRLCSYWARRLNMYQKAIYDWVQCDSSCHHIRHIFNEFYNLIFTPIRDN